MSTPRHPIGDSIAVAPTLDVYRAPNAYTFVESPTVPPKRKRVEPAPISVKGFSR